MSLNSLDGKFLRLSYQHTLSESDNFRHANRAEVGAISAGFLSHYLDFKGSYNYSFVQKEGLSWQTDFIFKPPGNCLKFLLSLKQIVGRSDIDKRLIPEFQFEGSF